MKKLFFLFLLWEVSACAPGSHLSKQRTGSVQLPTLGWEWQATGAETTLSRFKELKEAGVTCDFIYFPDLATTEKGLKTAAAAGIKMVVYCPELKTDTKNAIQKIRGYPALAGYFLSDEPSRGAFPELGEWAKKIHALDDRHFCYINLLPNYANEAQLGAPSYQAYVAAFIKEVPVPFLSFDHYPVIGDSLRWNWYQNLEIVSEEARSAQKPFWAFALTLSHGPYPIPTLAELRLQVFSDLAYGAQGIQYFRYWTPQNTEWDFHHGPISGDHKRTEVYDRLKQVNNEIVHLSSVFLGASVISVAHTGDTLPFGTRRLTNLPAPIKALQTKGTGALVSVLKNGKEDFLVVVNRDFKKPMTLILRCDPMVQKVLKDGSRVPASAYDSTLEIDPGDAAIYSWKN